jgi:hypothetical protein
LDFLQSRHLDLIFWVSITVETARFEQHDPSFGPKTLPPFITNKQFLLHRLIYRIRTSAMKTRD